MRTVDCTIVGQANAHNAGSFGTYTSVATYAGANVSNGYYAYAMHFKTPAFVGLLKNITFNIYIKSNYHTNINLRYALATSDENKLSYRQTYNEVADDNQIAYGIFSLANMSTSEYKYYTISLDSINMTPDTDYYLFLWGTNNSSLTTVGAISYSTISLSYEDGLIYIYGCPSYEGGSDYATILGQAYRSNDYSTGGAYAGYNGSMYYDYRLKFTTPSFSGVSDTITFNIEIHNNDYSSTQEGIYRYALCTSDANASLYKNHGNEVNNDEYQIASGIATFTNLNNATVTKKIAINTGILQPSTTYYLFIWSYKYGDWYYIASIGGIASHSILIDYNVPTEDSKIFSYEPYAVYIDNGTGWDMYVPYIDNGTGWDIVC